MDIIIPCAGLSTRFPNMKPKYLLEDKNLDTMIFNVAKKLYKENKVYFTILKKHENDYQVSSLLKKIFDNNINIIVLENVTNGPAETVYLSLKEINNDAPFLVRDCDSFFDFELNTNNKVFVYDLQKNSNISNINNLSYVACDKNFLIKQIVEKRKISNIFCVGGYQFSSKKNYIKTFDQLSQKDNEIFISQIIEKMILEGENFFAQEVSNYVNVGTIDDWNNYLALTK